ncbi:endonuclease [Thorsellia anophelis]|uniref:Deoxyribonuclease-1 n=1 Tax=Thorsellia anophelis DSM 18579 TaxID=1123402 RepID=A0A1I0F3D9_9GAMM|nr:endonuclease [Thorsellia anophelis]SET52410.1 deoxyribonuclease-1 [Thorsellia anophelis DSM 18579]
MHNNTFSPPVKLLKITIIGIFLITLPTFSAPQNEKKHVPKNFTQAKKSLIKIYQNTPNPVTFYCNCPISWVGKKSVIDLESCGYKYRKNESRALRLEWEHVVPASKFIPYSLTGEPRACWKNGGRKNCEKNDPEYQKMEADLHNLQPAIGEVNGDRGNLPFSSWDSNTGQVYGQCTIKIDFKRDEVEPPDSAKGQIARTYLYMYDRYKLNFSLAELILMDHWNKTFPVTAWECERERTIASIQLNHNQYVKNDCDKLKL